jgi:hypothetical protein
MAEVEEFFHEYKRPIGLCSAACSLLVSSLIIGFGSSILVETVDYRNSGISIWYWSLVEVVIQVFSILSCIIKTISYIEVQEEQEENGTFRKMTKIGYYNLDICEIMLLTLSFVLFIWGCVVYSQLGLHTDVPTNLWTFFNVIFWFSVSLWCLLGCLRCCRLFTACLVAVFVNK